MSMNSKYIKRIAEFFVVGVIFNLADNLLSIRVATDAPITPQIVGLVLILTIPFAVVSELLVDGNNIFRHSR